MSFAEPDDLLTLHPGISTEKATLVLEMVSAGIVAGVQWPVEEHTATQIVRPETGKPVRQVVLPALRVTAATVTVGGSVLVEDVGYYRDEDRGIITLQDPTTQDVQVDYTAGWISTEVPAIFKTVCLEWAVQYAGNPGNVKSYMMGGVSETFNRSSSSELVIKDARLSAYSLEPAL